MANRSRRSYKTIHVRLGLKPRRRLETIKSKPSTHSSHHCQSRVSPINSSQTLTESPHLSTEKSVLKSPAVARSHVTSSNVSIRLQDDTKGLTTDHHREKKSKTPWKKIVMISLGIGLIMIMALTITLSVVLTRKEEVNRQRGPPAFLRWNATGIIVAGSGSGGATGNPVMNPLGFTFDAMKRIYIAEYWGHRISRWVLGASNGTIIAGSINGIGGSTASSFNQTTDILLDSNGDMYISDRANNRLQFWLNGASSATSVAGVGSNTSINLNTPCLLTRDPTTKEIYIASTYSHTIMSYPSGSVFGIRNVAGITADRLNGPEGVLFDSFTNSLIIGNNWANSVVRWPLGSTNWTLIAGVPGVAGNDSIHLNRPFGIDLDPMGNLYVADFYNRRVQLFVNGQSQGVTIAGRGINGTLLGWTGGLKLDSQLNLFLADHTQNRVIMFSRY